MACFLARSRCNVANLVIGLRTARRLFFDLLCTETELIQTVITGAASTTTSCRVPGRRGAGRRGWPATYDAGVWADLRQQAGVGGLLALLLLRTVRRRGAALNCDGWDYVPVFVADGCAVRQLRGVAIAVHSPPLNSDACAGCLAPAVQDILESLSL